MPPTPVSEKSSRWTKERGRNMTHRTNPEFTRSPSSIPCSRSSLLYFTSSLVHFFTRSLSFGHCPLCSASHSAQIPPFSVCNRMKPLNMTVFLFACGSAFCRTSSAEPAQKKHKPRRQLPSISPVRGAISPIQTNGFSRGLLGGIVSNGDSRWGAHENARAIGEI
jgi:hypothetical protein